MQSNTQHQIPDDYLEVVKNGKRRAYLENQLYTIYQHQRLSDRYGQLQKNLPKPYATSTLLGILVFLMLDGLLTLSILGLGSSPGLSIGQILVHKDIAIFFVIKSLITAVFLGVMAVHKHYDFSKGVTGKQLILSSSTVYVVLLGYLFTLVSNI